MEVLMRVAIVLLLSFFALGLAAGEVFLPVSGTVNGVFFSDARIFNPTDHEVTIQAYYLPRGNGSNAGEQAVTFTVPSRQVKIYDDIVAALLHRGDVGGIRFVAADDFVVTQRIYALTSANCGASPINPCTLGQFVQGRERTSASNNGVILQLKQNANFRTNVGAVNPNGVAAHVTWRLYDRSSALVATSAAPMEMPPYAVIGPTGIASTVFYDAPATADLSDAWVSFSSDQPILAYGSVVDNGSTDQTFIPSTADSGVPGSGAKTVTISAKTWEFTATPSGTLTKGDTVRFILSSTQDTHGFALYDPEGNELISVDAMSAGAPPIERSVVLAANGTYYYFCTFFACGGSYLGHTGMGGELPVAEPAP
jgi:plastocyanin